MNRLTQPDIVQGLTLTGRKELTAEDKRRAAASAAAENTGIGIGISSAAPKDKREEPLLSPAQNDYDLYDGRFHAPFHRVPEYTTAAGTGTKWEATISAATVP